MRQQSAWMCFYARGKLNAPCRPELRCLAGSGQRKRVHAWKTRCRKWTREWVNALLETAWWNVVINNASRKSSVSFQLHFSCTKTFVETLASFSSCLARSWFGFVPRVEDSSDVSRVERSREYIWYIEWKAGVVCGLLEVFGIMSGLK